MKLFERKDHECRIPSTISKSVLPLFWTELNPYKGVTTILWNSSKWSYRPKYNFNSKRTKIFLKTMIVYFQIKDRLLPAVIMFYSQGPNDASNAIFLFWAKMKTVITPSSNDNSKIFCTRNQGHGFQFYERYLYF